MKQRYMVIDVSRCHDCNTCFMSCKDEYFQNDWPHYSVSQPRYGHRWINIERKERGQYPRVDVCYRPTPCMHCEDAPCVRAGNGAVIRREDGVVYIDPVKAKGLKMLTDSCPYGAIYWNEKENVAQKCTMCAHLLDQGWETTRCAHACPTGALRFYTVEPEDMERIVSEEGLETLYPELNTRPHVFYKNLYRFDSHFIAGAVISKGDCVKGAHVTLMCAGKGDVEKQQTDCFGEFKFDGLKSGIYTVAIEPCFELTLKIDKSRNLGTITI